MKTNLLNRHKSDVEEELRFHIEMLEHKYTQQGMAAADARAAALKRFGNLERIKRQCVHISSRNTLLRRIVKMALIILALTGITIHVCSSDQKIAHIGDTLVMIAIAGRLLLYVRGLAPSSFLPKNKQRSNLYDA
jgi:hypothetical protein